ncbi:PREDICTED: ribonuclease P/MRP protein subunit POP5 [Nicrophorus vespilloides]|uniref:Ribonuclease P/MRP protein subunit POP5 n=1 Tax=Nicrophorus vespilloides TaxID=110193 RepID=A0ABM1MUU6_NICVS|nr:PREDICTED: ribonuclease P/MRP protein subunit POP5 [Nicrophorus vespilloides]
MVRTKNRYIVVQIDDQGANGQDKGSAVFKGQSIQNAIIHHVLQMHGDFGFAAVKAALTVKYINERTRIAIIRCRHGPHKLVSSVLPLVNLLDTKRVQLTIIYTGATIRQCLICIISYQQRKFEEFCIGIKTEEEKCELKEQIMKLENLGRI